MGEVWRELGIEITKQENFPLLAKGGPELIKFF
jgi:hypothetical protein